MVVVLSVVCTVRGCGCGWCSYKEQCDAEVARERQRLATDARSAEQQRDAAAATAKRDAEQRLSEVQRRYDDERRSTAVRFWVFCFFCLLAFVVVFVFN